MLWSLIWRTTLFYIFILAIMRVLGKREIDKLAPIDLIVVIMIAELAVIPIEDDKMPIWAGIVPILILATLEVGFAFVCLFSKTWRGIIYGGPSLVIRDGKINEREMRKIRWNLDDLLQQMRLAGYANVNDVEVAIVETNGKLSIIPKSQKRPVKPTDIGVSTSYEGLQLALVKDGAIDERALKEADLDEAWLKARLAEKGISDVRDCYLATMTTSGELFIQPRTGKRGIMAYLPGT